MAKVTFKHLRQAHFCTPGIRRWCSQHGFMMRDFREGIDSQRLRDTGCGFACRAAELAEQEALANGQ